MKLAALVGDVKKEPVGYLQLSGFSKGAAQELEQAYRYLDANANGGLRGVILDLRGNPGTAKLITSKFVLQRLRAEGVYVVSKISTRKSTYAAL